MTLTPVSLTDFPWQPESTISGNLAIGNLRENLLIRLRLNGKTHAETLSVAIGCLAGFAAQNTALIGAAEATLNQGHAPNDSVVIVATAQGHRYLLGNWINAHLYHPHAGNQFPFFGLIAGSAMQCGVKEQELCDIKEMAAYVVRTMGTPSFGIVRGPADHRPHLQPLELLRLLWPFFRQILRHIEPKKMVEMEPPIDERHWPIIASVVAAQFLAMMKEVLDPRISLPLMMESAVISSKLDPELIEPGKWALETDGGRLAVRVSASTPTR